MLSIHTILVLAVSLSISNGLAVQRRGWLEPSADASDWDNAVCKPVGIIFARGTFDSGNIGTWVGPQFLQPLQQQGVAIQGVHANRYPATLDSYLNIGVTPSGIAGSVELASQVKKYLDTCTNSIVVISGWSQGALVAREGYRRLDLEHQQRVKAMVTFGDPITRFQNLQQSLGSLPILPHDIGCNTDNDAADPLCISIPEVQKLLGSTTVKSFSITNILGPWLQIPRLSTGVQQMISLLKLVANFLPQLKQALPAFVHDATSFETAARLLLWPSHFFYGNNGHAEQAAKWVLAQPAIASALKSNGIQSQPRRISAPTSKQTSQQSLKHKN